MKVLKNNDDYAKHAAYIDIFSCKAYSPSVAARFAGEFFEAQEMRVSMNFRY